MKRYFPVFYLPLLFSIAGLLLLSCGDSDDKDISKPKVSNKASSLDEATKVQPQDVNFVAEEKAIRELFDSHTASVNADKVDDIMRHWLKLEKLDVFVAHEFAGVQTVAEKWSIVKSFWAGTKPAFGGAPVTETVLEIVIDTRARNATLRGDFVWDLKAVGKLTGKYIAACQKDKGVWKIRAIDFGDKTRRIKPIKKKPPQ